MHLRTLSIAAGPLLFTIFFGVLAWTGRTMFGSRTFLSRPTDPKGFWIAVAAYLALILWGMKDRPDIQQAVAAFFRVTR